MNNESKSKRQQLAERRRGVVAVPVLKEPGFKQDSAATAALTGGLVVALLASIFAGIIKTQHASERAACTTTFAGDTPGIDACKSDVKTRETIIFVGIIIVVLAAFGLFKLKKSRA